MYYICKSINVFSIKKIKLLYFFIYLAPPIAIGYKSCCGNFSQPMQSVSKASVPSVRCSRRSSSDSGCFSIDLFLRKPLRPRSTPADWMARIRSLLFWRLKYGIRRCFLAKPWLMRRYYIQSMPMLRCSIGPIPESVRQSSELLSVESSSIALSWERREKKKRSWRSDRDSQSLGRDKLRPFFM